MSVAFEDITEEMGANPEQESWVSVVEGMSVYRVWQDENNIIVYTVDMDKDRDNCMTQADDEVQEHVLDLMENYEPDTSTI